MVSIKERKLIWNLLNKQLGCDGRKLQRKAPKKGLEKPEKINITKTELALITCLLDFGNSKDGWQDVNQLLKSRNIPYLPSKENVSNQIKFLIQKGLAQKRWFHDQDNRKRSRKTRQYRIRPTIEAYGMLNMILPNFKTIGTAYIGNVSKQMGQSFTDSESNFKIRCDNLDLYLLAKEKEVLELEAAIIKEKMRLTQNELNKKEAEVNK